MFRPHKAKWTMSLIALGAALAAATPVLSSPEGDYLRFCSLCHGFDGTGKGPLADALKRPPANLTLLTRRHGGKFPAEYAKEVITKGGDIIGHGSSEMLPWGPTFSAEEAGGMPDDRIRIEGLVRYIESIQAP